MTFLKENWFKVLLSVGVLIVGLSVAYYFLIALPGYKQEQLNIQQSEQDYKQQQDTQKRLEEKQKADNLQTCLDNSETRYSDLWNKECQAQGKLTKSCQEVLIDYPTWESYSKAKNITGLDGVTDYYKKRDDCSCRLPTSSADTLNGYLQNFKDECHKVYQ